MKKLFILTVMGLLLSSSLFAQQCIENAWMNLRNGQIGKAKKTIEECMPGNEQNADVWLMRGNVYLQLYQREADRLKKDPAYKSMEPEAALIASESFLKALEIDLKVQPRTGMFGADEGQILCAQPILEMAYTAMDMKEYDLAYKYFNLGATNLKLDKQDPILNLRLGLIYKNVAIISMIQQNDDNTKKALQDAIRAKAPIPFPYYSMYEFYRNANDTLNCEKVLKMAKANVPDSTNEYFDALELANLKVKYLDYYALTNETDKLVKFADEMANESNDTIVLAIIAGQLNNNNQFEKAEAVAKKGLALAPNNFDLNQQMGYRYYYPAGEYDKTIDQAKLDRDLDLANKLTEEQKVLLENAHTWLEKAYMINGDDKQNNIMLNQMKVRLRKPIPEDLKAKVDSYYKSK